MRSGREKPRKREANEGVGGVVFELEADHLDHALGSELLEDVFLRHVLEIWTSDKSLTGDEAQRDLRAHPVPLECGGLGQDGVLLGCLCLHQERPRLDDLGDGYFA